LKDFRAPVSVFGHVVVVALFTWFVIGGGAPAVRHDWLFPAERPAFVQRMFDLAFGWDPEGLGAAYPYPMTYWVTLPLAGIAALLGAQAALATLVGGIGIAAVAVSQLLVRRLKMHALSAPAIAALLLFNPWVYNKIVAGHLTQTLAYLGLAAVIVEVLEVRLHRFPLAFAVALSALQTQLFFIAIACCALRIRAAAARWAIGAGLIIYLPSLIGIVLNRDTLLGWPFTIAWENQQSVPISGGLLLQGYFTHYADRAFGGPVTIAIVALAVLALAAALLERTRAAIALALGVILTLLFCSGTIGPIAALWRWCILHVPEVGVYRELYDVICVCAIGYIVLAARAIARRPPLVLVSLVIACAFVAAWFIAPPSTLWVWQRDLPPRPASLASAARYALLPAFQPASFDGRGEGADPLYVGLSSENTALNALLPAYPADVALGHYVQGGSTADFAALGVSRVECRRGFEETAATRAFYRLPVTAMPCADVSIAASPVISFASGWSECAICRRLDAGDVFFADLHGGAIAIAQQRDDVDPARGWVDARLIFASNPDLGQAFGGAYTEQQASSLAIPSAPYLLVWVQGRLVDDRGRDISGDTRGYAWIALDPHVTSVQCRGRCVVALASTVAPPLDVKIQHNGEALAFSRPLSFLAFVDVPGRAGLLRFTETFDPSWTALDLNTFRELRHIRLDATFNAWARPAAPRTSRVLLVETSAFVQAVAMIPGFIAIAIILFQWTTQGWLSRARERRPG
jgi:hypothetical protein